MNSKSDAIAPKVAVLTGAAGFIGSDLLKPLLDDGYHVISVIRSKKRRLMPMPNKNVPEDMMSLELTPADRIEALVKTLDLNAEQQCRLHYVESSLGPETDTELLYQGLVSILKCIGSTRIDVVIHTAASLAQESPGMSPDKRAHIREKNLMTNVQGLTSFLRCLENFGCPQTVRVIRPSIVCGKGSKTGFMAFLNFFGRKTWGIPNHRLLGPILRLQEKIPFYGNPEAVIDIIDVHDVRKAMLAFVERDSDDSWASIESTYSIGAVHYVSTAYVQGKATGVLLEEDVYSRPGQEYNNSYEESKALGEHTLHEWYSQVLLKHLQDDQLVKEHMDTHFIFNNVSNRNAPTLKQLTENVFNSLGWSENINKKIIYCQSQEDLFRVLNSMRLRLVANVWRIYWKRVEVLYPYLLRETGTYFDTTNTMKVVGPGWSRGSFKRYFTFQAVSTRYRTTPLWKRCFQCNS